jgi:DNA polymerase-3 subunit gamma/tau
VELALIKLCYLQQAISFTNDEGKSVIKKQLTETGKPVAFKVIQPVAIKSKQGIKPSPDVQPAKLLIEQNAQPVAENINKVAEQEIPIKQVAEHSFPLTKLGSLDKLRQKVKAQNRAAEPVKELNEAEVKKAWQQFIDHLKKNNNHSAISHFNEAVLKIIDNNTIEIIAESPLQQSFIENERAGLIEHLQLYFNNRFLLYKLTVMPDENKKLVKEVYLSAKDQYLKMIEIYPLVKELKEGLRLNLKL